MSDIGIETYGHVALVEIRRPPNNFFDIPLIKDIAAGAVLLASVTASVIGLIIFLPKLPNLANWLR